MQSKSAINAQYTSMLSIQVWNQFPYQATFIVHSLIGVQSFWMRCWWLNQHFKKISMCRLYIADPVTLRGESRVVSVCIFSLWDFLTVYSIEYQHSLCHIYEWVICRTYEWVMCHKYAQYHIWNAFPHQVAFTVHGLVVSSITFRGSFEWIWWPVSSCLFLHFLDPSFFVGAIGN